MQLSSAAYEHYWQKGWCVVEGVFAIEECDDMAALAVEVSQREMAADSSYVADRSDDGSQVLPRKIAGPFAKIGRAHV